MDQPIPDPSRVSAVPGRVMATSRVISDLYVYQPISILLSKHPTLSTYIQFLTAGQMSGPERSARLANQIKELRRLLTFVESQLSQVRVSGSISPAPFAEPCYDDLHQLMQLRVLTFLRREAQRHHNEFHAGCFNAVSDHRQCIASLVNFLESASLPPGMICDIDLRRLSVTQFPVAIALHSAAVKRLEAAIRRISDDVATFPRAPWSVDFGRFFRGLVARAVRRATPDSAYVYPMDEEDSLGRYFFNAASQMRTQIDAFLQQITTNPPEIFTATFLKTCQNLIPDCGSLPKMEQSLAMLLMYRCLFNRCYELIPSFFEPFRDMQLITRIARLGHLPASNFRIPWQLISPQDRNQSVMDVFAKDRWVSEAARFLSDALFASNPIDQLFSVNSVLIGLQKAAMINRLQGQVATLEDCHRMLPFDDLFSLFFGALVASGVPNILWLSWMIENYAPKVSLSPPFEYARVNLEALVLHCLRLEAELAETPDAEHQKAPTE
jgi:hypothetical protein